MVVCQYIYLVFSAEDIGEYTSQTAPSIGSCTSTEARCTSGYYQHGSGHKRTGYNIKSRTKLIPNGMRLRIATMTAMPRLRSVKAYTRKAENAVMGHCENNRHMVMYKIMDRPATIINGDRFSKVVKELPVRLQLQIQLILDLCILERYIHSHLWPLCNQNRIPRCRVTLTCVINDSLKIWLR